MGKENSAIVLKNVVDEAIDKDVKVVFVQQEFNPRQVETFARELGVDVVMINPLNYDWATEIIDIAHAHTKWVCSDRFSLFLTALPFHLSKSRIFIALSTISKLLQKSLKSILLPPVVH